MRRAQGPTALPSRTSRTRASRCGQARRPWRGQRRRATAAPLGARNKRNRHLKGMKIPFNKAVYYKILASAINSNIRKKFPKRVTTQRKSAGLKYIRDINLMRRSGLLLFRALISPMAITMAVVALVGGSVTGCSGRGRGPVVVAAPSVRRRSTTIASGWGVGLLGSSLLCCCFDLRPDC